MIYDIQIPEVNFDHLNKLKGELDSLRPIDPQIMEKIEKKISLDWTYNSNSIEGNTLTYGETELFLNRGITSKGKSLNEYLEIKNHDSAIETLKEYIKGDRELTVGLIKEFHAMLFEGNETIKQKTDKGQIIDVSVLPGQYKQFNNFVLLRDGTQKRYEDPLQVSPRMDQLVTYYNENKDIIHPIILASIIHAEFVNIHPFVDGNGRTARIIMNLILMKSGYVPAIIKTEDKDAYFDALSEFDNSGDITLFIDEIEKAEIRTIETVISAATGKLVIDQGDITKVIKNFGDRMKALDKSIGKVTKKISTEEKQLEIDKMRNFIFEYLGKNVVSDELFEIEIENEYNLLNIRLRSHFFEQIQEKKIFIENSDILDLKDNRRYYKDYLSSNTGSCVKVKLIGKRSYIPTFHMYLICLPSKYKLYLVSYTIGTRLDEKERELSHLPILSYIGKGIVFEDWSKEDLKNFLNENISSFFKQVETEAEERRLRIEEGE